MLVPAILHKDQIAREFQKHFYSNDILLETGSLQNWIPDIVENPSFETRQYAIVDHENKLIGYLGYRINYYNSSVYNFGLFSFDRGNAIIGRDLYNHMNELIQKYHRVEWRMVGGNPVERHYDRFCQMHNGTKHVLKDAVKDESGNYRNDIIYEIVSGGGEMTNKEKLIVLCRGASNKAIAKYFAERDTCDFCIFEHGSPECKKHDCKEGIHKWLESEVEE